MCRAAAAPCIPAPPPLCARGTVWGKKPSNIRHISFPWPRAFTHPSPPWCCDHSAKGCSRVHACSPAAVGAARRELAHRGTGWTGTPRHTAVGSARGHSGVCNYCFQLLLVPACLVFALNYHSQGLRLTVFPAASWKRSSDQNITSLQLPTCLNRCLAGFRSRLSEVFS